MSGDTLRAKLIEVFATEVTPDYADELAGMTTAVFAGWLRDEATALARIARKLSIRSEDDRALILLELADSISPKEQDGDWTVSRNDRSSSESDRFLQG